MWRGGPPAPGAWPGRDVGMGGARPRALAAGKMAGRREAGRSRLGGRGDVSSPAAESLLVWGTGLLSSSGSFPTIRL